jgi:peptidoglycan/xylan/chitin deacetylase (PgdA/CDA1 family)
MKLYIPALATSLFILSCSNNKAANNEQPSKEDTKTAKVASVSSTTDSSKSLPIADAATIMSRKQVPVLCYHHIRNTDKPHKSEYEVSIPTFQQQMKALADSGYHTITSEQYYKYLTTGAALPDKPVMITFDDTDEDQFTIGKTEMDKYGFKGVFFIMTVSIGRPHYMTKEQIKQLSDEGHDVECHTWDHHMVTKYTGDDWTKQLDNPRKKLEDITGKKIEYFAYPFGLWNEAAIPEIKKRGYKLAFQLGTKRDPQEPLYTVRRIIVGPWGASGLIKAMESSFKG